MSNSELNEASIYSILAACLLLIGGCVLLNISLVYGFLISIILSYAIFLNKGFRARELNRMIFSGLYECRILYLLILLIGATVSIWLSSGVVPAMIYYGFEYMKGVNFLLAAFLITAVCSIFMGTAVGTVSTVGIAIIGIGKGFGIPENVLLGAVVSGAFIADKISPISGLLNLTLSLTRTNYRDALKSMLITLLPTILMSAVIYYFLGLRYSSSWDIRGISEFQSAIKGGFFISPLLLLLPVLIVIMSFSGIKIIYSILMGLLGGVITSLIVQKIPVVKIINAILFGYRGNTPSAKLNGILVSGGMVSMLGVLLIVMGAIILSNLLEGTGIIGFVVDKVAARISRKSELIFKTGVISGILTVVTCDQTMGIVLPGRLIGNRYDELKVSKNILARTISDTGTIIAPLMPWNVNALIIGLISGIRAAGYAPFAVLCYISPLVTFIYALVCNKTNKKY